MPKVVELTVAEELKKNPSIKQQDIDSLREWVTKQPHLPQVSDFMLILFLHSCYYREEPAKAVIDTFYTLRTKWDDLFSARSMSNRSMQHIIHVGLYHKLEGQTKEGYNAYVIGLMDHNPNSYIFTDMLKLSNMMVDIWLREYGTAEGSVYIIDLHGFTLSHLTKINLVSIKKALIYLQEAIPFRLKAIHYVNPPAFMDRILGLLKPFTKKEIFEMIHIHPNFESLYEHIPKTMLSSNLGGSCESYESSLKKMQEILADNDEWWEYDEKNCRVDESKRMGSVNTVDQMFGVEGSFKKLDLD